MQSEVGETVTAPDLVDVVAGALAKHAVPAWGADGKTGTCFCSEPINAERPTIHARTRALSAHQARAVLDALTEAGEVEWGVRNLDGPDPMWKSTERAAVEKEVNRFPNYRTLVSRFTLPWTAVGE